MAINANHPFEELNGQRCAVVEKNCTQARVEFLKYILEGNGFEVVVVASPPPKAAAAPAAAKVAAPDDTTASVPVAAASENPVAAPSPAPVNPETFTVGVTDVTFNMTNAIYGRLLRSPDGRVVTMAYWQQKEEQSRDDIPYFAH